MIRLAAGCKINLGLRITGIRQDGRHELETLFYPLRQPCDHLYISSTGSGAFSLDCPSLALAQQDNLVYRAWQKFRSFAGFAPGLRVRLVKRIPAGAGLGGGSSDAACLIAWLNREHGSPLDSNQLNAAAAAIGADVPFFLEEGPAAAAGIGDRLSRVRLRGSGLYLLLVCPGIHVSTAWAYAAYDEKGLTKRKTAAKSSNSACVDALAIDIHNDLETPVFARWPGLVGLKNEILALGAVKAAMSGSGSSVYGIFSDWNVAQTAACSLRQRWPRAYLARMRDFGM